MSSINISSSNVSGKCDLKCSYNFKYTASSSTAKNNGVLISITYDSQTAPPVIYNNEKYTVTNVEIVSPSIHIYNGKQLSGEILVYHSPIMGGNTLTVGVPLITSGDTSNAGNMITDVIKKMASTAPSEGDSTNLNDDAFNLQNIIPKQPFYSYVEGTTDWIIFGAMDAIPLTSSTVSTLQQIISPYALATPGDNLFYNSKGPDTGLKIGDGLYISCQPTGSSKQTTMVSYDTNPSSAVDTSSFLAKNSIGYKILLSLAICILFMAVFYLLSVFIKYILSDDMNMNMNMNINMSKWLKR